MEQGLYLRRWWVYLLSWAGPVCSPAQIWESALERSQKSRDERHPAIQSGCGCGQGEPCGIQILDAYGVTAEERAYQTV